MLFCEPCDHFRGAHGLLLDSQVVNAIGLIFGQELVRDLENSVMGSGAILGGLYREENPTFWLLIMFTVAMRLFMG